MYLTRRQTVSRCVAHRRFGGGAAIVALAAAWSAGALAQGGNLPPTYGTRTLSTSEAGRVSLDLQAGGNLSAQQYLGSRLRRHGRGSAGFPHQSARVWYG